MSMQTTAENEIRQAFLAMSDAWNVGDVDAFVHHWQPEVTVFSFEGGLLGESGFDKATVKGWYDAGMKPAVAVHQPAVKVWGDTALVTCYLSGSHTWGGDGRIEKGLWRYSEMLVKQDGTWKGVHVHWSLLIAEHSITKP